MATIDQQFVEYIVKTLVNNPDEVAVERKIDEKGVLLSLTVAPEDVGRIIGKRGMTAQAIRVLLRALGTKQDARYNLKIVNNDEGGRDSEEDRSSEGRDERREEGEQNEEQYDEPVEANEESESENGDADEESSELAEKTRAELADLDDLDI